MYLAKPIEGADGTIVEVPLPVEEQYVGVDGELVTTGAEDRTYQADVETEGRTVTWNVLWRGAWVFMCITDQNSAPGAKALDLGDPYDPVTWERVLTPGERTGIENYLGLSSSLPDGTTTGDVFRDVKGDRKVLRVFDYLAGEWRDLSAV